MEERINELRNKIDNVISAKDQEIAQLKKELEGYKSQKDKDDLDEIAEELLKQITAE